VPQLIALPDALCHLLTHAWARIVTNTVGKDLSESPQLLRAQRLNVVLCADRFEDAFQDIVGQRTSRGNPWVRVDRILFVATALALICGVFDNMFVIGRPATVSKLGWLVPHDLGRERAIEFVCVDVI
jgi:hypothetical protein